MAASRGPLSTRFQKLAAAECFSFFTQAQVTRTWRSECTGCIPERQLLRFRNGSRVKPGTTRVSSCKISMFQATTARNLSPPLRRVPILGPPHPRGAAIRRYAVGGGEGGACGRPYKPDSGGFGDRPGGTTAPARGARWKARRRRTGKARTRRPDEGNWRQKPLIPNRPAV
jgi:hypothetical protein